MSPTTRFLVVEDDETVRELIALVHAEEGYDVMTAPHGAAALDLIHTRGELDAIFLDLWMPVMDGIEFSRVFRQLLAPRAPIILLTAFHQPYFPARRVGADCYLSKPFELEDLIRIARRYSLPRLTAA